MTKEQEEKIAEFAGEIVHKIGALLQDEIALEEEDIATFIHALSTVAPTAVFNNITGEQKSHLEFNHIANRLCFQFSIKENEK